MGSILFKCLVRLATARLEAGLGSKDCTTAHVHLAVGEPTWLGRGFFFKQVLYNHYHRELLFSFLFFFLFVATKFNIINIYGWLLQCNKTVLFTQTEINKGPCDIISHSNTLISITRGMHCDWLLICWSANDNEKTLCSFRLRLRKEKQWSHFLCLDFFLHYFSMTFKQTLFLFFSSFHVTTVPGIKSKTGQPESDDGQADFSSASYFIACLTL